MVILTKSSPRASIMPAIIGLVLLIVVCIIFFLKQNGTDEGAWQPVDANRKAPVFTDGREVIVVSVIASSQDEQLDFDANRLIDVKIELTGPAFAGVQNYHESVPVPGAVVYNVYDPRKTGTITVTTHMQRKEGATTNLACRVLRLAISQVLVGNSVNYNTPADEAKPLICYTVIFP